MTEAGTSLLSAVSAAEAPEIQYARAAYDAIRRSMGAAAAAPDKLQSHDILKRRFIEAVLGESHPSTPFLKWAVDILGPDYSSVLETIAAPIAPRTGLLSDQPVNRRYFQWSRDYRGLPKQSRSKRYDHDEVFSKLAVILDVASGLTGPRWRSMFDDLREWARRSVAQTKQAGHGVMSWVADPSPDSAMPPGALSAAEAVLSVPYGYDGMLMVEPDRELVQWRGAVVPKAGSVEFLVAASRALATFVVSMSRVGRDQTAAVVSQDKSPLGDLTSNMDDAYQGVIEWIDDLERRCKARVRKNVTMEKWLEAVDPGKSTGIPSIQQSSIGTNYGNKYKWITAPQVTSYPSITAAQWSTSAGHGAYRLR